MIAYPDVDVNLGIDAKRGNRLWKVIKAIARNRGCAVEDIPDSEWARVRWLMESNAKLEALTDAEFAELVAEADNHIEWERYQEARDAYAEEIHA
jgi:hypothetical protein